MTEKNLVPAELVPDPELRVALTEACGKHYREWLYGGAAFTAGSNEEVGEALGQLAEHRRLMEEHERYMRRAEEEKRRAQIYSNPHMREITETLRRRGGYAGQVCPKCGEPYRGNTLNGKPWCLRCSKPEERKPREITFKELP